MGVLTVLSIDDEQWVCDGFNCSWFPTATFSFLRKNIKRQHVLSVCLPALLWCFLLAGLSSCFASFFVATGLCECWPSESAPQPSAWGYISRHLYGWFMALNICTISLSTCSHPVTFHSNHGCGTFMASLLDRTWFFFILHMLHPIYAVHLLLMSKLFLSYPPKKNRTRGPTWENCHELWYSACSASHPAWHGWEVEALAMAMSYFQGCP